VSSDDVVAGGIGGGDDSGAEVWKSGSSAGGAGAGVAVSGVGWSGRSLGFALALLTGGVIGRSCPAVDNVALPGGGRPATISACGVGTVAGSWGVKMKLVLGPLGRFGVKNGMVGMVVAGVVATMAGCSSDGTGSGASVDRKVTRGLEPAPKSGAVVNDERPIVLVNGEPVRWDAVRGKLMEAAGAGVVEEIALEKGLERACAKAGVSVSAADIARERELFAEALVATGTMEAMDQRKAAQVLEDVRRDRGLGDERFASLLRRTAMLRRLVQGEVAVTPAAIDQAYAMRYGDRYRARLITAPTSNDAAIALQRVNGGESFEAVAAEMSTDLSAARGGLLDWISPVDPTWPSVLRDALTKLTPGQVSPVFSVENGYAIVKLEERIGQESSAAPALEMVRGELEREVRLRQERLLMSQMARRVMAETEVSVVDGKLKEAWERRR